MHKRIIHDMPSCMRTTIDLNDELLRAAKRKAADEGIPLRAVIERALRDALQPERARSTYRLHWRTEKGRILPGVRLDDRDDLLDLMEGRR